MRGKKIEFKGGLLGQVCSVKITRNRQSGMKGKFMGLEEKSELEMKIIVQMSMSVEVVPTKD